MANVCARGSIRRRRQQVLLKQDHLPLLPWISSQGGAIPAVGHQSLRGIGVVLDEIDPTAAEDAAAGRARRRSGTAVPKPLSWQPTTSRPPKCTFQFLGAIARCAENNWLRVLGKDMGLLESDRQSFPKKNVGVNVHEGRKENVPKQRSEGAL
jgi:hypothetical protein